MDLADWLLEQIAEDERTVRPFRSDSGVPARWRCDDVGGIVRDVGPMPFGLTDVISESDTHLAATHIAAWDPGRVLAECDAKRRIIELATGEEGIAHSDGLIEGEYGDDPDHAGTTLRLLALPYVDRPGYLEEWAPRA